MSLSAPTPKIVILGDSTIDNRIWLGPETVQLMLNSMVPGKFTFSRFFQQLRRMNPMAPKSVVQNLRDRLPNNILIVDRTNDGFTTEDVLNGAYKDKVFGEGRHDFFPHEFFEPLETDELKDASHIILSVGGNNFREFILNAMSQPAGEARESYIKTNYPIVFDYLLRDYKSIILRLSEKSPNAHIILMTQYFPAIQQRMLTMTNIYQFMAELGKILGTGNAEDTIIKVMKDTYGDGLNFITTEPMLQGRKFSIVDVTSSLNPNCSAYFTGQIEPSHEGGQRIAKMLAHVIEQSHLASNKIYRFLPGFFRSEAADNALVEQCDIDRDFNYQIVRPSQMYQPSSGIISQWITPTLGAATFVGLYAFAGYGALLSAVPALFSMWGSQRLKSMIQEEPTEVDRTVYQFVAPTVENSESDDTLEECAPFLIHRAARSGQSPTEDNDATRQAEKRKAPKI